MKAADIAAKIGYHYLRKGYYNFQIWKEAMIDKLGQFLSEKAHMVADEISRFFEEIWNENFDSSLYAQYINLSGGSLKKENNDKQSPEAQYSELDYDAENLTEAQQLATDAVMAALNDNPELDVAIATDEEVEAQKRRSGKVPWISIIEIFFVPLQKFL